MFLLISSNKEPYLFRYSCQLFSRLDGNLDESIKFWQCVRLINNGRRGITPTPFLYIQYLINIMVSLLHAHQVGDLSKVKIIHKRKNIISFMNLIDKNKKYYMITLSGLFTPYFLS